MPDLLIVDGGKGQMGIAKDVADNLQITLNIAGLVKNSRHKTEALLYGFPQMQAGVKPDSELFRLLEQMQEEVHRVAITFHKKKRSKRQIAGELTEIDGIGEKTAVEMLKKFKSVKRMAEALRVNPTRMEMSRIKKRLVTAKRGHKLLKDKRDEMVRQFITLVRENAALRVEVEKELKTALGNFAMARAVMDPTALEEAVMYPARSVSVTCGSGVKVSVTSPSDERR